MLPRLRLPYSYPVKHQRYPCWDTDMTLCIGALARMIEPHGEPCIVLCFDSKVSAANDEFASETEYKYHRLSGELVSLFAGSPGRAKELVWIYREFLRANNLDKLHVVEQLREPIRTLKRRLANSYFSRTLGLSYEEVLQNGDQWFGKDYKRRLRIAENHPLRVDLVIAGFIGHFSVLCELQHGELELKTNYAMVGNGAYTAEPIMHARQHTEQAYVFDAIYTAFEAKKMGEYSPSVGSFTRIFVLHPPRNSGESISVELVSPIGMDHLGEMFDKFGPKVLPPQVEFPTNSLVRVI